MIPFCLIASLTDSQLWHIVPLVVAISFVYGATRHELIGPVLRDTFKAATWIICFMAIIFVILLLSSWNL